MTQKNFERLNFLSDKSINDTITFRELIEFKKLIADWNSAFELDQLKDFYNTDLSDHTTH